MEAATALTDAQLAQLRQRAERETGMFVNPGQLARVTAFVVGRREWASAVVGHLFNVRTMTHREMVLLDLAATAEPNPPEPPQQPAPWEPGCVPSERERKFNQRCHEELREWERLKAALPFPTSVSHNYSSRHHYEFYVQGADHILVWEFVQIGRLRRTQGDALCETPSRARSLHFPHADHQLPEDRYPTCKACLRTAYRIAELPRPPDNSGLDIGETDV